MLARLKDRKSSPLALGAVLALVIASGQEAQCAAQTPPSAQASDSAGAPAYGQPAGSALDQTAPAYGQPAGSALDQVVPPNGQSQASILDQLPRQPMQPPAGQGFPSSRLRQASGQTPCRDSRDSL